MERLVLLVISTVGILACQPAGKAAFDRWDSSFRDADPKFEHVATALWISTYHEDPITHRFHRTLAWGSVPEKLEPDGSGGYGVAIPLLVQGESSEGPQPDTFETVLVRVLQLGDQWTMVPTDSLPGEVVGWNNRGKRTVVFRGRYHDQGLQEIWQFQGRY